jgi:isoleucyl-tRNA synthetase
LTNVYIKLNRPRLKGELNNESDWIHGLSVLHHANMVLSKMIAAFAPYLAEHTYQILKACYPADHKENSESIHFLMIPKPLFMGSGDDKLEKEVIEVVRSVDRMKDILVMARRCRESKKLGFSQPLKSLHVIHDDQQ